MGFMHGRLLGVIRARRYYSLPLPPQRNKHPRFLTYCLNMNKDRPKGTVNKTGFSSPETIPRLHLRAPG